MSASKEKAKGGSKPGPNVPKPLHLFPLPMGDESFAERFKEESPRCSVDSATFNELIGRNLARDLELRLSVERTPQNRYRGGAGVFDILAEKQRLEEAAAIERLSIRENQEDVNKKQEREGLEEATDDSGTSLAPARLPKQKFNENHIVTIVKAIVGFFPVLEIRAEHLHEIQAFDQHFIAIQDTVRTLTAGTESIGEEELRSVCNTCRLLLECMIDELLRRLQGAGGTREPEAKSRYREHDGQSRGRYSGGVLSLDEKLKGLKSVLPGPPSRINCFYNVSQLCNGLSHHNRTMMKGSLLTAFLDILTGMGAVFDTVTEDLQRPVKHFRPNTHVNMPSGRSSLSARVRQHQAHAAAQHQAQAQAQAMQYMDPMMYSQMVYNQQRGMSYGPSFPMQPMMYPPPPSADQMNAEMGEGVEERGQGAPPFSHPILMHPPPQFPGNYVNAPHQGQGAQQQQRSRPPPAHKNRRGKDNVPESAQGRGQPKVPAPESSIQ
mmetsp:Transcript_492/g.985  ORF Transcript_492/g.985 Transcript_492/m.985 type:complete len:493 (-) Transcript_492:2140-3618(-)|eukprot:CAMPEP_0113872552 /NCGR_PEP_ID=MMETSP0780_2-20120614/3276_1 /TAXON_ID=652834 /ORGANISM="Palpitomonas bilix" /LENGTH=492 /DNA_ID=CAMNT_0000858095 /DNA_START=80 /DNA_END=1558 /DNA_ORIENTATION=+ /assembly_acc=CAM_ASM_000599